MGINETKWKSQKELKEYTDVAPVVRKSRGFHDNHEIKTTKKVNKLQVQKKKKGSIVQQKLSLSVDQNPKYREASYRMGVQPQGMYEHTKNNGFAKFL